MLSLKEKRSITEFIRDMKSLHYAMVKKDQCQSLEVALATTFHLGLQTYQTKCTIFFISLDAPKFVFYFILIDLYS